MRLDSIEKRDKVNGLLYMARNGHLPFIENAWIYETAFYKANRKLTKVDVITCKKILKKITGYRGIEKMKTFLFSIPYEQRINFIKYFLDLNDENKNRKIH